MSRLFDISDSPRGDRRFRSVDEVRGPQYVELASAETD